MTRTHQPGHHALTWQHRDTPVANQATYYARAKDGHLNAVVSIDGGAWHISVTHTKRLPTWDEMTDARYALAPDHITMGILMPPRAEYVNLHPRCLHLWQTDNQAAAS